MSAVAASVGKDVVKVLQRRDGKLVELGFPQPAACTCDPGVLPADGEEPPGVGPGFHRAEFIHPEIAVSPANPQLRIDDASTGVDHDPYPYDQEQWREQQDRKAGKDDIEDPLGHEMISSSTDLVTVLMTSSTCPSLRS